MEDSGKEELDLSGEEGGILDATNEAVKRILYVDDEEDNGVLVSAWLSRMSGHNVTTLGSGEEAFSVVSNDNSWDLLITDNNMGAGRMTGEQLAVHARRIGVRKVVIYTLCPEGVKEEIDGVEIWSKNGINDDVFAGKVRRILGG
ncbi:MAG: hypothetical protein V1679_01620 [Candidatus Peregrinibacteria bacterium]